MILSENMRLLSNKIDEYLTSIKENDGIAKKGQGTSGDNISLDSMLTSQADASKVAGSINIQKLVHSLGLPDDKAEMFKGAIAALQKNPPQLDGQQAAVLLLGFQKISSTGNIAESSLFESSAELDAILAKHPGALERFVNTGEFDDEFFTDVYEYYLNNGEMPYNVAKARDGDPYAWVADKLQDYIDKRSQSDDSFTLSEDYNPQFSDEVKFHEVEMALRDARRFAPDAEETVVGLVRALVKIAQKHQINVEVNALFNATIHTVQFATGGDRTNLLALFHDLDARFTHLDTLSENEYQYVHALLEKLARSLWTQYLTNKERENPAPLTHALGTPV